MAAKAQWGGIHQCGRPASKEGMSWRRACRHAHLCRLCIPHSLCAPAVWTSHMGCIPSCTALTLRVNHPGSVPCSAYNEMKRFTFRVAVDIIVGFDDSWTQPGPDGFERVNTLFKDWLDGLFRWAKLEIVPCSSCTAAVGASSAKSPSAAAPCACSSRQGPPRTRPAAVLPCSFPIALPGTAFARAMKARAALLQHINASLDLLEAQDRDEQDERGAAVQAAAAAPDGGTPGGGAGPAERTQRTALGLLRASRDEQGRRLSRQAAGRRAKSWQGMPGGMSLPGCSPAAAQRRCCRHSTPHHAAPCCAVPALQGRAGRPGADAAVCGA